MSTLGMLFLIAFFIIGGILLFVGGILLIIGCASEVSEKEVLVPVGRTLLVVGVYIFATGIGALIFNAFDIL